MTKKGSRFGNFLVQQATSEPAAPEPVQSAPQVARPTGAAEAAPIPVAPEREERRPFSTRLKPSLKRALDTYVTELKLAGWPVSQEGVLEELVKALEEDAELKAHVTQRLTRR